MQQPELLTALLGLPFDAGSSFERGAAAAPAAIREALHSPAGNLCAESGLDLGTDGRWKDLGDLDLPTDSPADTAAVFATIERTAGDLAGRGVRPLCLGGDHSVTLPVLRALVAHHGPLTVLHVDAHPDLYDELDGNRLSHACPFARAHEEGLIRRHVQVGIRALTPHQREQAKRFGVEMFELCEGWPDEGVDGRPGGRTFFAGPVHLSIDLDGIDPAHCPGVSHREPGGLTTRQVVDLVGSLHGDLVGADLVELNPARDVGGMSAGVAAKLVKEMLARLLAG